MGKPIRQGRAGEVNLRRTFRWRVFHSVSNGPSYSGNSIRFSARVDYPTGTIRRRHRMSVVGRLTSSWTRTSPSRTHQTPSSARPHARRKAFREYATDHARPRKPFLCLPNRAAGILNSQHEWRGPVASSTPGIFCVDHKSTTRARQGKSIERATSKEVLSIRPCRQSS